MLLCDHSPQSGARGPLFCMLQAAGSLQEVIREPLRLPWHEDWEMNYIISRNSEIYCCPDTLEYCHADEPVISHLHILGRQRRNLSMPTLCEGWNGIAECGYLSAMSTSYL